MAARSIPDRIVWAMETLNVGSSDQVLEIGCGHGRAVPLVCEKLARGKLTAIDRSAKMIAAAQKRNQALVAEGKVEFETVALADADFGRQRFSKIFAINVNLFWIDLAEELPVVRRLLRPDGVLYLFYEPPSPAQMKPLAAKLAHHLESGGFVIEKTMNGQGSSARCLCVMARSARSTR
jgi:SAM-dependent methyltransferase